MKVLELQPEKRVLWQVVDGPGEWIGTRIGFDLKPLRTTCSTHDNGSAFLGEASGGATRPP